MLRRLYLAPAFLVLALLPGCAARGGYRTYDPGYRDYHVWTNAEVPYYNSWIVETHRPHVEFRRLPNRDRQQYWRWRHDHH
jgi:hypothetical protein